MNWCDKRIVSALCVLIAAAWASAGCVSGWRSGVGVSPHAEWSGLRTVIVNVVVQDELSQPIEGLVVLAAADIDGQQAATNGAGEVSLSVQVGVGYDDILVGVYQPRVTGTLAEYEARFDRYVEVLTNYSFSPQYRIALDSNIDEYSLVITAFDAVVISGVLQNEVGAPVESLVSVVGAAPWFAISSSGDGSFQLGGVRKGQAAIVLLDTSNGQKVVVDLDATETLDDVDLGTVVLQQTPADGQLDLTISDWDDLDLRARLPDGAITLVSEDGEKIFDYWLNATGKAVNEEGGTVSPSIPAGTYFVSPDASIMSPISSALIRLAREGVVDLHAAGVPSIVVPAGQTGTAVLSVVAAEQAIIDADN